MNVLILVWKSRVLYMSLTYLLKIKILIGRLNLSKRLRLHIIFKKTEAKKLSAVENMSGKPSADEK